MAWCRKQATKQWKSIQVYEKQLCKKQLYRLLQSVMDGDEGKHKEWMYQGLSAGTSSWVMHNIYQAMMDQW